MQFLRVKTPTRMPYETMLLLKSVGFIIRLFGKDKDQPKCTSLRHV